MYPRLRRRLVPLCGLLALSALLVAPSAQAQTIRINGGSTTLEPDSGAVRAIVGAGIDVSAIAPGRAGAAGFTLPIVRGSITRRRAVVTHRGGIALTRGDQGVTLTNLVVTLDRTPDVTAVVNGGTRVSILDLGGRAPRITRTRTSVRVSNLTVRLTPAAATALNTAFATSLFKPRQVLGQTTTRARVAAPRRR